MKPAAALEAVRAVAAELGYELTDVSRTVVHVALSGGVRLEFEAIGDDDLRACFPDTDWHAHHPFMFDGGSGRLVEYEAPGLLRAIGCGDLCLVESFVEGELSGRWPVHSAAWSELQHLPLGEELRIRRHGDPTGRCRR